MKNYTKPCLTVENLLSLETVADGVTHDTSATFGPFGGSPIVGAAPDGAGGEVNVSVTSGTWSDWNSIMNGSN